MSATTTALARISPCASAGLSLVLPLAACCETLSHGADLLKGAARGIEFGSVPSRGFSSPQLLAAPGAVLVRPPRPTSRRWSLLLAGPGPTRPGITAAPQWPMGRSFASQAHPAPSDPRPDAAAASAAQQQHPASHASQQGPASGPQSPGQGRPQPQGAPHDSSATGGSSGGGGGGGGGGALERPPNDVTYVGPLAQQHKLLKRISITNTLIALAAAPAIVTWADNISLVSRYGLAASLVFFGLITTGALHWVAHPYVHELRYHAATGQIEARTTTLLGNSRWHTFNVDDVRPLPWNRPVATFTARDRFFYVDTFNFPDEQLLRRLTPDEADVPKGYKDKEDDDDD